MLLMIVFKGESYPYIEDDITIERCVRIIEKAKKMFELDENNVIVEEDRVVLHMRDKSISQIPAKKRKRLYCYNDRVILQTNGECPDEVDPTRELLAYEKHIEPKDICVVEI